MSATPLLELTDVEASIEGVDILNGVSAAVEEGEIVALAGRNGAGKTTTFRSIMGKTAVTSGAISYKGTDLDTVEAHEIPPMGIGYQPEERQLFTGLTVDENLRIPIWGRSANYDETEEEVVEQIYDIFTELKDRKEANVEVLSGGQGKMVAIGRALALKPDLLILDEPLEGLAPIAVQKLSEHIETINEQGIAVLIAESKLLHISDLADRIYIIERGETLTEGRPDELSEDILM